MCGDGVAGGVCERRFVGADADGDFECMGEGLRREANAGAGELQAVEEEGEL